MLPRVQAFYIAVRILSIDRAMQLIQQIVASVRPVISSVWLCSEDFLDSVF